MIATWIVVGLAVSLPQTDVDKCLRLADDQARLACYDRLFDRASLHATPGSVTANSARGATVPPAPAAVAPAAVAPAAVAAAGATEEPVGPSASAEATQPAETSFGLTSRQRPDGKIDAINGTIVEVEPSPAGRPVLVLDNGQRWRQVDSTTLPAFSAGESVTIRRAAFGSYLATVPDSGRAAVRVRRQD